MSTTLALTLSPTPRKLTAATTSMNTSAMIVTRPAESSKSKVTAKLAANARDAVDADVIPDAITVKATRNVRKCTPKALWVYKAAPAACGYFVTSSR